MTEPTTNAAAIAALAGSTAVTGSVMGVEYTALMMGFVGGITALLYLREFKTWWQPAASVTGATVLGGVISPLGVATAHHFAPWLVQADIPIGVISAFAIGFTSQIGVPVLFAWLKSVGDRLKGGGA